MKIKRAPVADLMKYFDELYENRRDYTNYSIFHIINKYYCSLTNHKTIMPINDDFINDWCDSNNSAAMEVCPHCPGTIIYKNLPDGTRRYGIIYHSGYVVPASKQTNYMSYYFVDEDGHVTSHVYLASDWDGWGMPTRYFYFDTKDYVESNSWQLGERTLQKHCFGHDVRVFQAMLAQAHTDLIVNGYFDDKTLEALHFTQYWCNVPQTNEIDITSPNGKKIIQFLVKSQVNNNGK